MESNRMDNENNQIWKCIVLNCFDNNFNYLDNGIEDR